ncbi:hypothetical protein RND81_13G081000 [Saponaria officinalis]|uniref:MADS-box domain-containing protein n=1 Tax=Saponaria officinalis TaxID=3572 RepID=A0AAW1GVB2_SAPOF
MCLPNSVHCICITRKITYKKRVKVLLRKTQELSILCGVNACIIVYSPYNETPLLWPSNESEVRQVMVAYKHNTNSDQPQKILTQDAFLRLSAIKTKDKISRLRRRNRELDLENDMGDLLSGQPVQQVPSGNVKDMLWVIEDRLRTVQHQIRVVEENKVNGPSYKE